MVIKGFAL